jgi:hypothetical protein
MSGFLDKTKELLDQHDDKVDRALDKVAEQLDRRTGSQYADQIDKGVQAAKEHTGQGDTTR